MKMRIESVGKLLRKSGNTLALFLLPGEKARMRVGFKNDLYFKSKRESIYGAITLILLLAPMLRAQTNSMPGGPAVISSAIGYFDENSRTATYLGNVQVDDPEMKLRCEWMKATLPPTGRPNHIVCETNVVIDAYQNGQTNHITSDKAVYDYAVQAGVTNETITFTGNPRIENAQAITTGDPIVWNRASGEISVTGEKMTFKQGFSPMAAKTNGPAKLQ
jgi:lipopolysaccharide export system protein LptA